MKKLRSLTIALALAFGTTVPLVAAGAACASTANSAALVVDTGGSVITYCVEIPSGGTDGIGLIKLASQQYSLSYNLGYGGQAVCQLNGVGASGGGDCLETEKPYFWGYWIGNGGGGWNWSSVGAGSTSVDPGDIQGWSWGKGTDSSSHPSPPSLEYEDVCKIKDDNDGGGGGNPNGGGGGGGKDDADDDATGGGGGGKKSDDTTNPEDTKRTGDDPKRSPDDGDTTDGEWTSAQVERQEARRTEREAARVAGGESASIATEPDATGASPVAAVPLASGGQPPATSSGGSSGAWTAFAVALIGGVIASAEVLRRRRLRKH